MKFIQKFKGMPHPIVCPSFYNAGFKGEIALCKESYPVWKKLGLDYKNPKCNCVL
jgi:hypothetical protein